MSRKKSLSSHLSRKDPDDKEFDDAIKEFQEGSDRVAAIMGAAFAENNLVKAIEASLPEPPEKSSFAALFYDEGSPFGTFRRRIVAARALNLVSAQMAADMDIVRDVRNQFAHALLKLDFENEHITRTMEAMSEYSFTLRERNVSAMRLKWEKACWAISVHLLKKANDHLDVRNQMLRSRNTINDLQAAVLKGGSYNVFGNIPTIKGAVKD